jgi:hypothetical protein
MSKVSVPKNLEAVKRALADKYQSLAKSAKSKDKQKEYLHNAEKYRSQAEKLGSQ